MPIAEAILAVASAKVRASGPVMGKDCPSCSCVVNAAVATAAISSEWINARLPSPVEEIDRLFAREFMEHAGSPLDELIRALVDAMIEAHTSDSELYELLLTEVPHRKGGSKDFSVRLHGAFLLAISSAAPELRQRGNLDKVVFVVTHMVEALCHGAVLRRPRGLSLADAKAEITRAVLAYLSA